MKHDKESFFLCRCAEALLFCCWRKPLLLAAVLLFCCSVAQTYAAPAEVWKTGQTKCYDTSGTAIACAGTGQDGDTQKGVVWPTPRFTDNNNGTITDNLTGLIWLKNADCFGWNNTWQDALTASNSLANGQCGLSDGSQSGEWRLPNRKELLSLLDFSNSGPPLPAGHPFTHVTALFYWSSSTYVNLPSWAWDVFMYNGSLGFSNKKIADHLVWPVRGGQSGSSSQNNCAASVSSSLVVHIPILTYSGAKYWADLKYNSTTGLLTVAGAGAVSDTSFYSSCTASTLSSDFKLHIPVLMISGVSYWLDLQYNGSVFTVAGAGQN